jgi:hypothetical protein
MSYTIQVRGLHALLMTTLAAWPAACGGGDTVADAPMADVVTQRCDPAAAFKPPVALTSLESARDDVSARLAPDELTIVFARINADLTYDLYSSTRTRVEDAFSTPQIMGSINSIYSDLWPTLTPDGLGIYFESDRITPGTFHVWTSHRLTTASAFGPPIMETGLADGDLDPYVTSTGGAIYVASAVRVGAGGSDIYRAARDATGALSPPIAVLGGVNSVADELTPAVTGDELRMFFCHNTATGCDTYTASRSAISDGFGAATPVDGLAVDGITEVPTWVSPDGCHLYFYSNVPGNSGGMDLYLATRE